MIFISLLSIHYNYKIDIKMTTFEEDEYFMEGGADSDQEIAVGDVDGTNASDDDSDEDSVNHNNNIDWGVFEGEGGILKLYDENENFLSRHFLIPGEKWYLKDSIELYTTLKFKTFSKKGKITFINNPGGGSDEEAGKQIKFDIPVFINY